MQKREFLTLRIWIAGVIFIGSYLPLALILLVQDVDFNRLKGTICWKIFEEGSSCELPLKHPYLSISILLGAFACFLVTLVVLNSTSPKRSINIKSTKYIPSELMNYTLPYVVSFMGVGYQDTGKFFGILVFLVWIFWITHRSGQIILNPVLIAFGWRLYDVTYNFPGDDTENQTTLISKGHIIDDLKYKYSSIQDVMLIRPDIDK